jgi:predicted GNAT family acetyltransferase
MTLIGSSLRALGESDRGSIQSFVDADPVGQCVFHARLMIARSLHPWDFGGQMWGIDRDPRPGLQAACYAGGNLIPLGGTTEDMTRLGSELGKQRRTWSSLVGRAEAVHPLWNAVGNRWGPARVMRANQPLLYIDHAPAVAPDPLVQRVVARDLGRYLPAAVSMFTEELEIEAPATGVNSPYRKRLAELISSGLAFARFDEQGRVIFKAEIAAVSPVCCQVQGVWVEPDLRGQGIGTAAMAAVVAYGLALAPAVSLYVNDFNHSARAMYARLGLRQIGTFATVLF